MRYPSCGFSHSPIALAWLLTHPWILFVIAGTHPAAAWGYFGRAGW